MKIRLKIVSAILFFLSLFASQAFSGSCDIEFSQLKTPPLVQQKKDHTCGPACAVSIIKLLKGTSVSEKKVARIMGTNSEIGTMPNQMIFGLKKFDIEARIAPGLDYNSLQKASKAGKKFILLVQSGSEAHWVVLAEIDDKNIKLMDPWREYSDYQIYGREEFNSLWRTTLAGEQKNHFGIEIDP